VLHVDDDPSASKLVARMLRSVGFRVTSTGGVDEALTVLAAEQADVVVSDLIMVGGDGFSLLSQLRERGTAPPVVMLTSVDDEATVEEARRLGVARFLTKPVGTDVLVEAIEAALKR